MKLITRHRGRDETPDSELDNRVVELVIVGIADSDEEVFKLQREDQSKRGRISFFNEQYTVTNIPANTLVHVLKF